MGENRMFVKSGGVWDNTADRLPYRRISGTWTLCHVYRRISGVWVLFPNWTASGPYPLNALTANNAPSPYVAAASSNYSATYAAWKAFNQSYADANGWCGTDADTSPWISLYFQEPLKDIYVTLRNRTRASLVNGVKAATIYGSNNGTNWDSIGSFSGRDGATSAYGSTHYCSNPDTAYTYLKLVPTDWERRTQSSDKYCAIGELYIYGKKAA